MNKQAPQAPHKIAPGPTACLLQVEASKRQHSTVYSSLSSTSQLEAAFRYYEIIASAAVQSAKEDQRMQSEPEGSLSPTDQPSC